MSRESDIQKAITGNRLLILPPSFAGEGAVRTLIISPEVQADVEGPFAENRDGIRCSVFRGSLDGWTENDCVTVSEDPDRKPGHTYLARVHNVRDEFWQIRCTKSHMRAIGAFVAHDGFVALTCDYREAIGDFNAEVRRCQSEWYALTKEKPLGGATLDDYLSNYYVVT